MAKPVKDYYQSIVQDYPHMIRSIVPDYESMIHDLVHTLPFDYNQCFDILDIGCGTGYLPLQIKQKFPFAQITCVDISDKMLAQAKKNLSPYDGIQYVIDDIEQFDFGCYHAVVSSLALQNLPSDQAKIQLYQTIHQHLNPGGVLSMFSIVLGATPVLENWNMARWKDHIDRDAEDGNEDSEQSLAYQAIDRPSTLTNEIQWLANSGFVNIDVVRKYYNFMVLTARKEKELPSL